MKIYGNQQSTASNQIAAFVQDTGTADHYVVSMRPVVVSYTEGLLVCFRALNANTGASTLSVNGLSPVAITKSVTSGLAAGDILAGEIIMAVFDGSNFQMVNKFSNAELFTENTVTVSLGGDGSVNNPLFGDVNISLAPNNALTTNADGLYVPNTIKQGVVYGGVVTWLSGYTYNVSAAGYYINGVFYSSPSTDITLSPADGTYNRIDTFIVDDQGTVSVLEGTPSDNPAQAPLDPATQLELSLALVEAGTIEPSISTDCIYKENVEWVTTTSNLTRLNPNSISSPYAGAKSIEGNAVVNGDNILFSRPGGAIGLLNNFTLVTLQIKSKGAWGSNGNNPRKLSFRFSLAGTAVGAAVSLSSGQYGFDSSNTTSFQTITFPLSAFSLSAGQQADAFTMTASMSNGSIGFFVDNICLQSMPVPVPAKTYLFRNGLTENPAGTVELGGTLLHNTTNYTGYFTHTWSGATVYNYPYQFEQAQNFGNSTGIASFKSKGASQPTSADYNNLVKLGINYTSDDYGSSIPGYVGSSIGYMINTNGTGNGSYGMRYEDADSKIAGVFFHTKDAGTEAITLLGRPAPLTGGYFNSLDNYRILTGHTDKTVTLHGYPYTRDDGNDTKFLTVDASGNLKLKNVVGGGGGGSLTIQDEGTDLTVRAKLNFIGPGVTAVDNSTTGVTDVTITGTGPALPYKSVQFNDSGVFGGDANFTWDKAIGQAEITGKIYVHKNSTNITSGYATGFYYNSVNWNSTITQAVGSVYASNFNMLEYNQNANITYDIGSNHTALLSLLRLGGTTSSSGTVAQNGGTTINRAMSSNGVYVQLNSNATGINPVFSHVAGVQVLGPQATNGAGATATNLGLITNYYGVLIGPSDEYTNASSRITNRYGLYQSGANDYNYFGGQITANTVPTYSSGGYTSVVWNTTTKRLESTTISGGLASITADNGLTANTSSNVRLGGTLLQNTTIDTTGSYKITVSGSEPTNSNGLFNVSQTAATGNGIYAVADSTNGSAIYAHATNGTGISSTGTTGVFGASSSGSGVWGQSTSGSGGFFSSSSYIPIRGQATPTSTNTAVCLLELVRKTSGTAATGIGGSINIYNDTSIGSPRLTSQLISKWTDAADATRTSQFEVYGVNNATTARKLALAGNGKLTLDGYGAGTQTGTATYGLAVDASGNVIETTGGGLSAITADNGLTANTSSNVRLGGTAIQNTNIDWSNYTLTNTWNSLTSGSGLLLSSSSTTLSGTSPKLVEISFTGNNTNSSQNSYALFVTNSHTGTAAGNFGIYSTASGTTGTAVTGDFTGNGAGVFGRSSAGVGVQGTSTSGTGGIFNSTTGYALGATVNNTTTNTVVSVASINRYTSGVAAAGLGAAFEYSLMDAGGTARTTTQLISKWTNAAAATRTSQFEIYGVNNAVTARKLALAGNGKLTLDGYGAGTQTGTATYSLGVDASGNVIETSGGGLSAITADNGLTANTSSNVQLGGTFASPATLLHHSYINNNGFTLNMTESGGNTILSLNNSGSGIGLQAQSGSNAAVWAISSTGTAVVATSQGSAFGVNAQSANSYGIYTRSQPASTNTVFGVLMVDRYTTGTPADGIGGSIDFSIQHTTGADISNQLVSKWTNATGATRTSQFEVWGVNSAVSAVKFIVKGSGVINIPTPPSTYADNTAAIAGGLVAGDLYKTSTGQLMIVF
jgi:hypothetical protein